MFPPPMRGTHVRKSRGKLRIQIDPVKLVSKYFKDINSLNPVDYPHKISNRINKEANVTNYS
jgi:hypothetical protein